MIDFKFLIHLINRTYITYTLQKTTKYALALHLNNCLTACSSEDFS